MRQTSRQKLYGLPQLGGAAWTLTPQACVQPPPAALPEVLKPKHIGYSLSDAQILQILDNLPQGKKHNRWRFAIQLCAV